MIDSLRRARLDPAPVGPRVDFQDSKASANMEYRDSKSIASERCRVIRRRGSVIGSVRVWVTAVLVAGTGAGSPGARSPDLRATIRTTSYGIPHITAEDFAGLGFGFGYAFAKDNVCEIADRWLTVNGERSRWFGPTATVPFGHVPLLSRPTNLASDFF